MCDFHSIIVTADGRIFHDPSNSHSTIARTYNLGVNTPDQHAFWECEWNGTGDMPINLVRNHRYGAENGTIPSIVERTAVRHYEKLALILKGELDPAMVHPFDQPEYSDVRAAYTVATVLKSVEPFAEQFADCDQSTQIELIRAIAEQLDVNLEDVCEEEIQSAVESATEDLYTWDSAVDCILNSGDYYSSDDVQEQIREATEGLHDDNALEEAKAEAYEEGFLACKNGSTPQAEYINGMPAFLFN